MRDLEALATGDDAVWRTRRLLPLSERPIDDLVSDLKALGDVMELKCHYKSLPESEVAPRVTATALAILALPTEPGVNLAEVISTLRKDFAAWHARISATPLPAIGIANLQRSSLKLMGTDLQVLEVALRAHAVCELMTVSLPMPCALKGDRLLHTPGLGAVISSILRAQSELVQQTSSSRTLDAIQANAAPATITLCDFDEAQQALFAREARWQPTAADEWLPGHTMSTGHVSFSVSEPGFPSSSRIEGGADTPSHGHSGTLNLGGKVFFCADTEPSLESATLPQLLDLLSRVGTPGGPTGAKVEWSVVQQQRQLVAVYGKMMRDTPYGNWHPVDSSARVALQRAARCDPHELHKSLESFLDPATDSERTILSSYGLSTEEALALYGHPRMTRAGVARTRMEHTTLKAARGSVAAVKAGGGRGGGGGAGDGRGGGREGRVDSVPKQLKVPEEHLAYTGKLIGDAAVLNALMLVMRGTTARIGPVSVTAALGSWKSYPLTTPAADETAHATTSTVDVDGLIWRFTSSSADKQGQWHYQLQGMRAAGVWSTEGSEAAVTLIIVTLVLLKEVLAEMEIAKHIRTLADSSAKLPMAMLLRGCDTPAGRQRWLAEVGRLFSQKRLMQRGAHNLHPAAH